MNLDETGRPDARVPKVTVVIPAYGVNAYIREALDSVLAQTFSDYQVIVVDDGSPPRESAELKAICASYDSRVVYMERENGGQSAARNTALAASRSEFVAFLDGDDYWAPNLLEQQLALFDAEPGLALAYADALIFGDSISAGSTYMSIVPSTGEVTLESLLALRCNVTMSTIVVRRSCIDAVGAFDESLRYSEDFDLWIRMAARGMRMRYRLEPLAFRRVRAEALSANDLKLNRGAVSVLERIERDFDLTPAERAACKASIRHVRTLIVVAESKRRILQHEYAAAADMLFAMDPSLVTWKLRVARFGLRTVPGVVRLSYGVLRLVQSLREQRHVQQMQAGQPARVRTGSPRPDGGPGGATGAARRKVA